MWVAATCSGGSRLVSRGEWRRRRGIRDGGGIARGGRRLLGERGLERSRARRRGTSSTRLEQGGEARAEADRDGSDVDSTRLLQRRAPRALGRRRRPTTASTSGCGGRGVGLEGCSGAAAGRWRGRQGGGRRRQTGGASVARGQGCQDICEREGRRGDGDGNHDDCVAGEAKCCGRMVAGSKRRRENGGAGKLSWPSTAGPACCSSLACATGRLHFFFLPCLSCVAAPSPRRSLSLQVPWFSLPSAGAQLPSLARGDAFRSSEPIDLPGLFSSHHDVGQAFGLDASVDSGTTEVSKCPRASRPGRRWVSSTARVRTGTGRRPPGRQLPAACEPGPRTLGTT